MRSIAKAAVLRFVVSAGACFALEKESYVELDTAHGSGSFVLAQGDRLASICVDPKDHVGVIRAAGDLRMDISRVTGRTPAMANAGSPAGDSVVIIGTIGKSALVDRLIRERMIDPSRISRTWESFLIQTVSSPLPGVGNALVIAGSDKRGTIYGIYDLSESIGVSPWYWWADVSVRHRDALYVKRGVYMQGPPSVKYRGIFLNDEWPDLTNWIGEKYGQVPLRSDPPTHEGIANYGSGFYTKIFELILRLKGNYLWPAMWNNAFNEDDPDNPRVADEYGIVMGSSHQEPMLRAQKEWDRRFLNSLGTWNYGRHPDVLEKFWREGIRRNRNFESIITIGLRGANDTPMAPGGPRENMKLLERIVRVQRTIISEETGRDAASVPQLWCLYKEVQDFYNEGMRVPDDVTLLWAEDNWGNLRRVPAPSERARKGSAGIYYHFDYHGGPRSYQWVNTSPIPKIWDQMSLARQYGADRIWIVNVGHFKGYEIPMEYFMSLAWNTDAWTAANAGEFTRRWAEREFGPELAGEIAEIVAAFTRFNGRRKPELLRPETYSLVNYGEADRVVADYNEIASRAERIHKALPPESRDAFYQTVLYPAKACAQLNEMYVAAGKNALYALQGRASANDMAARARALFQADREMAKYFNLRLSGGKWDHFMDQPHIGYTSWEDPPEDNLDAITLKEKRVPTTSAMGVAIDGSEDAWPGARKSAMLPQFDAFGSRHRPIDVFNKGKKAFQFTVSADAAWIRVSAREGAVEKETRLWVSVDWAKAPRGSARGAITIRGAGTEVTVAVASFNPAEPTRESLRGFVEGEGVVSMEAGHFTERKDAGESLWVEIKDYGRTLSGMRATAPMDAPAATPGKNSRCLEYGMYIFEGGTLDVTAIVSPTLNFMPGRGLRYAISFDDQIPRVVTLVPPDYNARNGNQDWERTVMDGVRYSRSTHTLSGPGYHTLRFWMVDPGVVLEKLVVDLGGLRSSYLGPPESFRN